MLNQQMLHQQSLKLNNIIELPYRAGPELDKLSYGPPPAPWIIPADRWDVPVSGLLDLLDALAMGILTPDQVRAPAADLVRTRTGNLSRWHGRGILTPVLSPETDALHREHQRAVALIPLPTILTPNPAYKRYIDWTYPATGFFGLLNALHDNLGTAYDTRQAVVDALNNAIPPGACCSRCGACAENYRDALDFVEQDNQRRTNPTAYPFATHNTTIHRATCPRLPERAGTWPTPPDTLAEYVHGPTLNRAIIDPAKPPAWHHWLASDEAHRWITRHIGPRGGHNYTVCRHCTPELPDRLSTEP